MEKQPQGIILNWPLNSPEATEVDLGTTNDEERSLGWTVDIHQTIAIFLQTER